MPVERRGQVTHVGMESTGNRRNFWSWRKAAAFSWGGTSRMNREVHVRICGRLGAKFPGPTRRRRGDPSPYADHTGYSFFGLLQRVGQCSQVLWKHAYDAPTRAVQV